MTSKEKIKNLEKERDYYKMQLDVIHQLILALRDFDDYSSEASTIRGNIHHFSDLSVLKDHIDYIIENGKDLGFYNDCYDDLVSLNIDFNRFMSKPD